MSTRSLILAWCEQRRLKDVDAALRLAGVLPGASDWRLFIDRVLLWAGAAALGAAVIFFIAHNWSALGRYAKLGLVETLMVAAVLAYCKLGPDRPSGKSALLVATLLLGALLALFGQTYQTGADTWQLFATWAALAAPWVAIGRFAALWVCWLAIANLALVLYFSVFSGLFGLVFAAEQQLWTLFAFNTAALAVWELAARGIAWMRERWAPRLIAIAGGAAVTLIALHAIFDWRPSTAAGAAAYPAWLACIYLVYRRRMCDLFVLAGACLSIIVVVTGLLVRAMMDGPHVAGAFLFIAIAVVAMAACSAWWLKQVAREVRG